RRRAHHRSPQFGAVDHADERGGRADHLRRRHHRHAARLWSRRQGHKLSGAAMLTETFEVKDERFRRLVMGNVHLEKLWTGSRWAEGPAYFPAGRYLIWSDIPNDRLL